MPLINTQTASLESLILFSIIICCTLIQLLFYLGIYLKPTLRSRDKVPCSNDYPPLSVVICCKNQLKELKENLLLILDLDYPKYEVIVIDMNSEDGSIDYLDQIKAKYPYLRTSQTSDHSRIISKKKLAQSIGIKASRHNWIIFTEPDCKPCSTQWLKEIAHGITPNREIILGYSKYKEGENRLQQLIAYENISFAIRFLGFALCKKAYTGLGTNMAYRKDLFFKKGGYTNQLSLQHGEDEIFINFNATEVNTATILTPESVTETVYKSKDKWINSKIYHYISSKQFKGMQHHIIALDSITLFLLYSIGTIATIFYLFSAQWVFMVSTLATLLLIWIVQMAITNYALKRLGDPNRFYFSILYYNITLPLLRLILKFKIPKKRRGDILHY